MSLLNWGGAVSQAGAGIAQFAGTAAVLQQKSDLDNQAAVLADQLATARESAGRQEAGGIAAAAAGKQQEFEAGQSAQLRASTEKIAAATESGETARSTALISSTAKTAAAAQLAETERTRMTLGNQPAEVKEAQWLSTASPEEKSVYQAAALAHAGVPAWVMGPDQGEGGPASTNGVTGKPAPASDKATVPDLGKGAANTPVSNFNEDALTNLPPSAAATVKAMVDGRQPPPTSFAMSKPYWQAMVAAANKYDPSFDQTTWAGRVATRKDFTAGQSAKAVTALNTALGHAGVVSNAFDQLDNGSVPALNAPINWLDKNLGGDKVTNAQEAVGALASEARKVFAASGGGNLTELENWEKNFPINGSPTQQKGAMKEFGNLLESRLEALSDQYNRGMGKTDDPLNLLEPHARQVYNELTGRNPQGAVGYPTGPQKQTTDQTGDALPFPKTAADAKVGSVYQTANGPMKWDGKLFMPPNAGQ